MKKFYEMHKKAFWGIVAAVCVVVCAATAGSVYLFASSKDADTPKDKEKTVEASAKNVKEEADTEEPEETEEIEETEEEEVSEEAAEVVEDSELDVVEQVDPAKASAKTPAKTPASEEAQGAPENSNPGADVSNMAQNVEFPYEIRVNKQMNCVTVYAMDQAGAYSIPFKAMVCSTGNATPLGTFHTPAKYVWKVLKGNVWGQYSTRVTGSILFHSVPYTAPRKDALKSSYYNKLGTTASAGCIRLTTADAKWIYDNCPLGTTVVIYNDSNPGPLGKPTAMKVAEDNHWDPTDPDAANPWKGRVLRIEGVQPLYIKERGYAFDAMSGVRAVDSSGNDVTARVQVSTNADVNNVGIYAVHYSVSDGMGNMATADATLQIKDTQAPCFAGIPGRIEGKKNSEINRALLLGGVSVTDNGQPFSLDHVEVQIPSLRDGENRITYVATDAYGNRAEAATIVVCDTTAPIVSRRSGVSVYIPLSQQMNVNEAVKRIQVQDQSQVNIQCNISKLAWGYRLDYKVTDSYGNVRDFTDTVTYLYYHFSGDKAVTVSSIDNMDQIKQGLCIKDSISISIGLPADVQVTVTQIDEHTFSAVFTYVYQSPLGSQTTTFTRTVTVK